MNENKNIWNYGGRWKQKRKKKNQEQVVVNATGYPGFQLT